MDVRYFNFLVRQPSARLVDRPTFWGMPKRGIALLLVNALFWQPFWAQAQGIAVSGGTNTTLGQAGNGVPIVNIAAPNATGLSHNQYQQYNVGAEGVILNNATGRTQSTQLGGIIVGNPNLKGNAASTILNEVTGANATQLQGYTEVAGQAARVIVANPYGISCNGCGFINTPRATLTTGKPVLGANGQLDHLQVDGGNVSIDGNGLDASTVDQFEIITRAAQINAQINAKQLAIVAGRNDVDAQTLNATARADDGSAKPSVAIDSSALGGMYAGAIKLVGTEAGVGVRLAGDLAASAGDIQIDANGQLNIAQVAASGGVNVKAASLESTGPVYAGTSLTASTRGDMNLQGNTAARDSITLASGGQLTNGGIVEAGVNPDNSRNGNGDIALSGRDVRNSGTVIASRGLTASAGQSLDNGNGQLRAGNALDINVGGRLDNQGGTVGAGQSLQVRSGSINNRGGNLVTDGDLGVSVSGDIDNSNSGRVQALGAAALVAQALDNRGGLLGSGEGLTVNADTSLLNNRGTVDAGGALLITAGNVDNTAGRVISDRTVDLGLSGALLNDQGLVSSEGTLSIRAGSLSNYSGSVSSAETLAIDTATGILNQGGNLVSDGGLNLRSASLDNSQGGMVSAKGPVGLQTGGFDNSHGGQLNSGAGLQLTAAQVINRDGGMIGSDGNLTASVSGLNQQGGTLFSKAGLTLDLNHGELNNTRGLINTPGALVLNNLAVVNNQNGEISSAQSFALAAQSVDNSGGKLLSNQSLGLSVAHSLTNLEGMIAAASLSTTAGSVDNSGGTLISRGPLQLNVDGLLSNRGGLINTPGAIELTAGSLDSSNGGEVSASGDITLSLGGLTQNGGRLLGESAVNLTLNGGDLSNRNGLISAKAGLNISQLRDLDNQAGEISSSERFGLTGRTLNNNSGKLVSNRQLALDATELLDQGGLISGWEGLAVKAGTLDNRDGGTLSSRNGDVSVTVSGDLLNGNAGALVSQKALSVTAAHLDNRGGILSSAAAQSLNVLGVLDNSEDGLIDSGAALAIAAANLNNNAGTLNAQQALGITGTNLNNSAGSIAGNGDITFDLLGTLSNNSGKLSSKGDLSLQHAGEVINQGGQFVSQGLLNLFTGALDNSNGGTVAANSALRITATGMVDNSHDGLMYSKNATLDLTAASLGNAQGVLQSQGALNLLVNGDIDTQAGRVIAQDGALSVAARNLNNRGGVLSSLSNTFSARITGVLKNGYDLDRHGGLIQAKGLDLRALAGIDNYGGRIAAQTANALIDTGTGSFDNRNGSLYAAQRVSVTGNNFDNSGDNDGQIAGWQIALSLTGALNNRFGIIESGSTVSITADNLDNQTGKLRALGVAGISQFNIGGMFDNRNGTLETANTDLALAAGGLLNTGGTILHVGSGNFGLSTANVMNAGGSLVTRGALTLNADNWTNSSVIQAGTLNVNVGTFTQTAAGQLLATDALIGTGAAWVNDGVLASDGTLSLNLSGTYAGGGRLSSLGSLDLTAAQLNLSSVGSLVGGAFTGINLSGELSNQGRLISSQALLITAGSVINTGTLGAADALTLNADSLLNDHSLIFSGQDMALRVRAFTNSYADVYSLAKLSVDRDGAGGLADSIVNSSGSIQSDKQMSLAASTLQNVRAILTTSDAGIYTAKVSEIACIEGVNAGDCSGKRNHVWEMVLRDKLEVTAASAASTITSGGSLTVTGGDLSNQSSLISAGGDFTANLNNLTNAGLQTSDTERYRIFRTQRTSSVGGYAALANAVTDKYWYESSGYDINNLDSIEDALARFIASTEAELTQFNSTRTLSSGDQSYAGVIQAGGSVHVSAQDNVDNSVVRAGYHYVGSGTRTDTTAPGTQTATVVTLNPQLAPDLAQQQVNPLTLPGFSLPTGENGLFRLSGEAGSNAQSPAATNGTQGWSMSSGNVALAQRGQSEGGAQPGSDGADSSLSTPATGIGRVQGVPSSAAKANPNKFLIETNPALTDLKQFMSSDYLLSGLGYDPDQSAKRLGDGLYEQRLIQQAITARTGQAFLEGQTSNEAQFKYLMNNAISSKEALDLTVGVSLTSEQVAALTHDIVWMEDTVVNGEHVLVPVLYLANANNRLAANGALIQGSDVTLIAGRDLTNAGTLRASSNLSANAGADVVNSGLVEAGNRLDLLGDDNVTNKAGGIIAGRDVSVSAVNGDVLNERTVTTHQSGVGTRTEQRDFADSAARIEAANDLSVSAGRDISNLGSVLQTGRDLTLSAGRDVNIASTEVANSLYLNSKHNSSDITQLGSTVTAGRDLSVQAGRDLNVIASQLEAKRDIALAATGNLAISSAADEEHSFSKSKKVTAEEDHVSQVASTVKAGGNVAASAGQDLTLVASKIEAGEEAYVYAGNNIELLSAQNEDYSYYQKTKKHSGTFSSSSKTTVRESSASVAEGSTIEAAGAVTVGAVQDINAQGATVTSTNGALRVTAGRDVTIAAAQSAYSQAQGVSKSKQGVLSGSAKVQRDASQQTVAQSSTFSGDTTSIRAGRDLSVEGSSIVSTQQTTLAATGNVLIDAATEAQDTQHSKSVKRSGLMGTGGIGVTLGNSLNQITQTSTGETQKPSTVGSVLGDVSVIAGKDVVVRGSELVAGNDISLTGRNVSVIAAPSQSTFEQTQKSRSSGLTLALSGKVGSALNNAVQDVNTARKQDAGDSRLNALQGIKAGLSSYQAWQAAQLADANGAIGGDGSYWGVSLSLGSQHSQSQQLQKQTTNQAGTLTAGRDVAITATGNQGAGGDILLQGTQVKVGRDISLDAKRDVLLLASADTQTLSGKNSSGGGSIGASIGGGTDRAGITVFANANAGRGTEKGNGVSWNETTLDAGRQASLNSGRDTALEGAQVSADQVVVNAGRDLLLSSSQDSNDYASRQQNVSGGLGFTFGTMNVSGNISLAQDRLKSTFDSVQEQTGLFAGKSGYQVTVANHTQLNGAVIGSTASSDKNSLTTGTLGWTNLHNQADFTAQHQSVSLGSGGSLGSQFAGNTASTLLAAANHSGHDSSTTHAAVSPGALLLTKPAQQTQNVATLNTDVAHAANALSPIFDKEKEQQRLQQVQQIADIGNQVMDVIRTQGAIEAANARKDPVALEAARQALVKGGNNAPTADEIAAKAGNTAMQQYGTGSSLQRAAQAVTAAVQGLAGGNLQAAISGAAAPYLANTIKQLAGDNDEARIMAQAVLGAVVAKAQGNSPAAGAAGAGVGELIAAALYPNTNHQDLTEGERQIVSMLSTLAAGLVGGLVGGDAAAGIAGAQAGQIAVENNNLSPPQIYAWAADMKGCEGRNDCDLVIKKYEALSTAQQLQLISDCNANPEICKEKYGDVLANSMAVKKAIESIEKEGVSPKMAYDMGVLFLQQSEVDGVVATGTVSLQLQKQYGLTETQSGIVASLIASMLGGTPRIGAKAAANGSGPAKGFLEVSDAYSSSKAVQGLSNSKPIDFIYDPASQRFIMGRNQFGHDGILDAGKIPSSDSIVGGGIWKENGILRTYEWSGHYGMNWTPELREQFKSFMSSHGVDVTHTPGISR
ncbi:hemagglutinin repeat-containing protein [Pseudomonas sp. Marseille-Q5115]|uniref:hemagglutinin repeat-containing protein n=1 Tax=Pseudomonas sp. Marseille-Q5115 TaxID=2866593 RepID=UPI001CE48429|nr:hemagglutinin repeat-containing protein [Pseudomonas sp. Marseille-Q5115]